MTERDLIPIPKVNPTTFNSYASAYMESNFNTFLQTLAYNPLEYVNFMVDWHYGATLNYWIENLGGAGASTDFNAAGFLELKCTDTNGNIAQRYIRLVPAGDTNGNDSIDWDKPVIMFFKGFFPLEGAAVPNRKAGVGWTANQLLSATLNIQGYGYGLRYERDGVQVMPLIYGANGLKVSTDGWVSGENNQNIWRIDHLPGVGAYFYIWDVANVAWKQVGKYETVADLPDGESDLYMQIGAMGSGGTGQKCIMTQMGIIRAMN